MSIPPHHDVSWSGYQRLSHLRELGQLACEAFSTVNAPVHVDTRYRFDWLCEAAEFALSLCPIQDGDRVRITRAPDFERAPGWSHCRHFLVVGAQGTARYIDIRNNRYYVSVHFDDESWVPDFDSEFQNLVKGVPVPVKEKHLFNFRADHLEKTS